jgi:hypothetical protein
MQLEVECQLTAFQLKPQSALLVPREAACQLGQAKRGLDWLSTDLQSNPSPMNEETKTLSLYWNWASMVPYVLMYPAIVETSDHKYCLSRLIRREK